MKQTKSLGLSDIDGNLISLMLDYRYLDQILIQCHHEKGEGWFTSPYVVNLTLETGQTVLKQEISMPTFGNVDREHSPWHPILSTGHLYCERQAIHSSHFR